VGIAFIILGIIALFFKSIPSSIIAFVIGAGIGLYSLFIPSERQIKNRLQKGMSSALIDLAQKKIENGSFHADIGKFREVVARMGPVFPKIPVVPEIGFDGLYIHFNRESDADEMVSELKELNLNVDVVQNKTDWAVKIEIA
jgi:hypothetical protein